MLRAYWANHYYSTCSNSRRFWTTLVRSSSPWWTVSVKGFWAVLNADETQARFQSCGWWCPSFLHPTHAITSCFELLRATCHCFTVFVAAITTLGKLHYLWPLGWWNSNHPKYCVTSCPLLPQTHLFKLALGIDGSIRAVTKSAPSSHLTCLSASSWAF